MISIKGWSKLGNSWKWAIFSLLSLALASVVYLNFFRVAPEERGALRTLKCPKCRHVEEKVVVDISDPAETQCTCSECGERMGYLFKCEDCQYEFSLIEKEPPKPEPGMKTMAKFHLALEARKCPNCGSTHTGPVPVK